MEEERGACVCVRDRQEQEFYKRKKKKMQVSDKGSKRNRFVPPSPIPEMKKSYGRIGHACEHMPVMWRCVAGDWAMFLEKEKKSEMKKEN